MAKVESDEIEDEIRRVLMAANTGKGTTHRGFLTAYQIYNRMDSSFQSVLVTAYGPKMGQGANANFTPASRVAQVADKMGGVDKAYLDTEDLEFDVGKSNDVEAGRPLCALFRIP